MKITEQTITLDSLRFYAYHGAEPQEAIVGAWYTVDICMKADVTDAILNDNLSGTINYAKVAEAVKQQMQFTLHDQRRKDMAIFKGAGVAITTPFKANGDVDYDVFREQFKIIYNFLEGELRLTSADLRRRNRNNMRYIGIKEEEVMAYTDNQGWGTAEEIEEDDLNPRDFKKPIPDLDSLAVHLSYARQLDSLLRVK